jgi:hypothetical protein
MRPICDSSRALATNVLIVVWSAATAKTKEARVKCPECHVPMYPSVSGPYDEPKIGGEIVHLVCPECDSYLNSMAVPRRLSLIEQVPEQLRLGQRPAA